MKVCHVSRSLCPRMVKLAWAQSASGITTGLITERPASYQQTIPFDSTSWLVGNDLRFGGLQPAIEKMQPHYDLFHVHTHMRDLHILEAVLRHSRIPIAWDKHDEPDYVPINAPQRNLAAVGRLIGPEGGLVYNTYCPREWFVEPQCKTTDFVIATGLSDVPGHFRYWLDVFRQIASAGYTLNCFTPSVIPEAYFKANVGMSPAKDVRDLIKTMSSHRYGLCGSPHPDANMLSAMPNKLYEYIAAGIPVICFGRKHAMASMIQNLGLGTAVDDVSELPQAIQYLESINAERNVKSPQARYHLCMENEVPGVSHFYKTVLQSGRHVSQGQ